MVFQELALGILSNLLSNEIQSRFPNSIDISDKAIKQLTNKYDKLEEHHIETFLHEDNVQKAIDNYLKHPDQNEIFSILKSEFFNLLDEEYFTENDAESILNDFFQILNDAIDMDDELATYLIKCMRKDVQDIRKNTELIPEIHNDVKKLLKISSSDKYDYENYDVQIESYLNQILDGKLCLNINIFYTELSLLETPVKYIFPLVLKADVENKPKKFEISELVEKESKLIISGDSGFGKTTTLRWLTYISAKKCLEDNPYIPIYVDLNNYIEGDFLNYVITCAKEYGLSEEVTRALFDNKIKDNNVLLLIDGLDLLKDTERFTPYTYISNLITDHPSCRYVISSRPGFFDRLNKQDFKISEIQELNEDKISSFIDQYLGDEKEIAKVIKNEILNNENISLFTNPLMLFLAINIAYSRLEKETILPSTRTELYEYFIENLFTHYEEKGKKLNSDQLQIEDVAKHLYFGIQSQNDVRCERKYALKIAKEKSKEITEEYDLRSVIGVNVLDDLFNLGLFKKDGKYVTYGFHQSFQEYYSAIKLKELFENGKDISLAFVHPKWKNTVIFASEMFENSDNFVKKIISIGEFELASKCSKNITENLRTEFCNSLYKKRTSKYSLERIIAARSLGRLHNLDYLKDFAEDKDPRIKDTVAEVLGDFKSDEAIEVLNVLLEDDDEYVTDTALFSLSNIGSEKAIESLFNAFKLENDEVTDTAIDVLSNIADKIDLDLIIEGLKDKNNDLRFGCIYLLKYLDLNPENEYEEIVTLLANIIEDGNKDDGVREAACQALIDLGTNVSLECVNNLLINGSHGIRKLILNSIDDFDENLPFKLNPALKPLIEQLNTETNCENRVNIIHILGLIGSEKVENIFLNLLKNDYTSVKKAVLGYLHFEQNEKLDIILDVLKEEDIELRIKAIQFLGGVRSKSSINPLMRLLDDDCPEIQKNVILTLGKINPEIIFEESILKLKDNNPLIKESIIGLVGTVNSRKAANILIESLKDEDILVRRMAIYYLTKMTLTELDELLIKNLRDENVHLKCNSIKILGVRNSKIAIKSLINILEKEKDLVKIRIVNALGLIKAKDASNQLRMLLSTTNPNLKTTVIRALGDIGSEDTGEILLDMLSDNNSELKNQLVWSLGQIAYSKAFKPILMALEQDDSIYLNSNFVLKNLNDIEHKDVLEDYSQSDNPLVADLCFEMLNEVKKAEMMERLILKQFN